MSPEARQTFLNSLSPDQIKALPYDWEFWAREKQRPPEGDWRMWMLMGGRGAGKTRTGAETVRLAVKHGYRRIALVGRTAADVRDVMIEGESGIMAVFPSWNKPLYEPSKRRITFPNGAIATAFSAEEPKLLRGPQFDFAWTDELAAWRDPDAFDQLQLGLRLGLQPRMVITTTPRPTPLIKDLLKNPACIPTTETTYANIANLAPSYIEYILRRYQNTTLGQQELMARILDDVEGALWRREIIERNRVTELPPLTRIVVAIDPAVTSGTDSDETGIVIGGRGADGRAYILGDFSLRASPAKWAERAIDLYEQYQADRIIGEANNGGDLIENTLRAINPNVSYKKITASRGKKKRAEPVSALYEQDRVKHVGAFGELEDQMCTWVDGESGYSPDRMDALVWCATELMIGGEKRSDVW